MLCMAMAAGEDVTRLPTAVWTAQGPLPPAGPYPLVAGGVSQWFTFDADSGVEQPRLQVDGGILARAGNVTLNIRQPYTLQARAGQNLNLYLVQAALGNLTRNAGGAVGFNSRAQLRRGAALEPGMDLALIVGAAGAVDQFQVARALNVPGGANFAVTLNTTLSANTAALTLGNSNNVDFNTRLNAGTANEQNRGVFATVVASPIGLPDSRAAIGVQLARTDPRLRVAGGQAATGRNIILGQIELGRSYRHEDLPPAALTIDAQGAADFYADEHALAGAGIMVGRNAAPERQGVAPDALLYSSAFTAYGGPGTQQILRSMNFMVDQPPAARVINASFGIPDLAFRDADDGDNPTARLYDFVVARRRTIVVTSAGNGGANGFPLPGQQGSQNGGIMSVGNSISGNNGAYNILSVGALDWDIKARTYFSSFGPTDHPVGMPRAKPDIMAPGTFILTTVAADLDRNRMIDDYERVFFGVDDLKRPPARRVAGADISGTSFAAPHVAGAVGMMLEYADFRDGGAAAGDRSDPRVIKAAVLNSASRTVRHRDGSPWTQGVVDVMGVPTAVQPLDNELGAGMIRVNQAMVQISPNETRAADNIPDAAKSTDIVGRPLTWDRQQINRSTVMGSRTVYYGVDRGLVRGQAMRITTTWNRMMNAADGNLAIDPTDTFIPTAVSNIDMRLFRELPHNDPDRGALGDYEKIRASESLYDNVELLDLTAPRNGPYWIQLLNKTNQADELAIAINIGSNPAASGGTVRTNSRRTPEDGVSTTLGDLLPVEAQSSVFVKHTFDRQALLGGQDSVFVLDANDGFSYTPGSTPSIYFGQELRDNPLDPTSDSDWFTGTIDLTSLTTTLDWRVLTSTAADSNGNLPPTLIGDSLFLSQLGSSVERFPEFNFVIDVDANGLFTAEVDGVGWFQIVPEPGASVIAAWLTAFLVRPIRRRPWRGRS
jgi:subtilisin family serine protease